MTATALTTEPRHRAVLLSAENGIWLVNNERCSAKHFSTGETANVVARDYAAWMKKIDPTSRWEAWDIRTDVTGICVPTVIQSTARDLFSRSGEKVGFETLYGRVMTNENGTPVGVLVCDHDSLECTERFFTINGIEVAERGLGW